MGETSKSTAVPTLKYKVCYSDKLGRYLQAATDLQPGEVIFREEPIIVGPLVINKHPVCFACMNLLQLYEEEDHYFCTKCNVAPLCGSACEERSIHHTPDECELFRTTEDIAKKNLHHILKYINGILLIIRFWLLQKRDPELWERARSMEAHLEKRRGTTEWKDREMNIINVMKSLNLVPHDDPSVSEVLQLMCAIIDVNSIELRPPGNIERVYLQGLFADTSLLSHDCRGNLHLTMDSKFKLTVYASVPIKEGDIICFSYTSPFLGTLSRRLHLRMTKYFDCNCSVCREPYELGSYVSAILCPRCRKGYLGMEDPLVEFPYEKKWKCNNCEHHMAGYLVKTTLNLCKLLVKEDIRDAKNCDNCTLLNVYSICIYWFVIIKELESLRRKLLRTLHRNHYYILEVKQKLLAIYRFEVTRPNPNKRFLENMLSICKEMYELLEVVEPGISRYKAITLFELHLAIVALAHKEYYRQEISAIEFASRLEEGASTLKKSLTMLLLEPLDTAEGRLAKKGLEKLKTLNETINNVKAVTEFAQLTIRGRRKLQKNK
ncbi:hypothetical protein E2986_08184 [Frieseomelitta varia]|uniref:SET domain-containing protein n=1 Tax=Frieseomelitta varia TaxID=561572 RepID=A0A833VZY3_9HYME|nr:hypothetical protein E2986_08184 [Frieseomelitta varia]